MIDIVNSSFESNEGISITGPGWAQVGGGWFGALSRMYGGFYPLIDPTPDPLDSESTGWSNGADTFQVLAAVLQPNSTYTLIVDVGDRTDHPFGGGEIRLGTGSNYGENYLQGLIVNNSAPINGDGPNDGWSTWITTYTTGPAPIGAGELLRIELDGFGIQSLFDNVRLDVQSEAVPENGSTFTMLGLCAGSFLLFHTGIRRRSITSSNY